jgi:hypothetical protein
MLASTNSITQLWTAAGVLLGFQVTSFLWRVQQEAATAEKDDITWLPPADMVNLAGMLVVVIGIFVAPSIGLESERMTRTVFGFGALLFVGHCFALAGHYEMYNSHTKRSFTYFPIQERVVVAVVLLVVAAYFVVVAR